MTRDNIIRMAREAGMHGMLTDVVTTLDELERFAALVAAHEREACARVCEETTASWSQHDYNSGCIDCAKAIRARGEK